MYLIRDKKAIDFGLKFGYVALAIFVSYFVGGRGEEVGTDTGNYIYFFSAIANSEELDFGFNRIEFGFYWLTKIIGFFTQSPSIYLAIIFLIQFIAITGPFFKRSELFDRYLLLSFIWLAYPFFYSITLNVLRQGVAFAFVIYGIDRYLCGNRKTPYLFILAGVAFHYVSFIYLFGLFFEKIKIEKLLIAWLGAVVLAMTGGMVYLLNSIEVLMNIFGVNSYYFTYIDGGIGGDYLTGFKLVFFLASITPILLIFLLQLLDFDVGKINFRLIKVYIIINTLYFLTTELPYNDRFAIASWLLVPYIITNIISRNIKILYPLVVLAPIFAAISLYFQLID